jgi:hypothetical protein
MVDHAHEHGMHHHQGPIIVSQLPSLEGFDLIDSLDTLVNRQADEALHTLVPHSDNPVLQREHLSLFELVRYDEVTHLAIKSGSWSDPATWQAGVVPSEGARALVPIGVRVTVDDIIVTPIATLRIDGTLSFNATRNTELHVDTVVVASSGSFEMGTANEPIAPGVRARLVFTDNGPIDRAKDPFGMSRGLISHGKVHVYGAMVPSYAALSRAVLAGTQTLTFKSAPLGWNVGHTIVIAGTKTGVEQNEERRIQAINGNVVVLDRPLNYDHVAPSGDLEIHVAHLTRNAVFESEAFATDRRGHVMFMHNRDVSISYAAFYRLGRTDKSQPINDPVVDGSWTLKPGTGTNPRARYPVHFHRNGLSNDGNPAVIQGSAVVDSRGWGFVNHSSNVDMYSNVAFGVNGASFVTEVGDEIGGFYGNFAVGTTGTGAKGTNEEVNARESVQDFGFSGDGFWFQGAGVSVVGNISAGNQAHAYIFYTRGLYENGVRRDFPAANLPDSAIADGQTFIPVGQVPMANFSGNIGYASAMGLVVRYHLEGSLHGERSVFEDSTFWSNNWGVALPYAQNVTLRRLRVVHDGSSAATIGIGSYNVVEGNTTYDNVVVTGYGLGILVPRWGTNVINGGTFNNQIDIQIQTAAIRERLVQLNNLPWQTRIDTHDNLYPLPNATLSNFWVKDTVLLNFGQFVNQRLYSHIQRATAVPFPEFRPDIPSEYVGLTNQQLWSQFGVAIGDAIAPSNTITVPTIYGLIAPGP